MSNSSLLSPVRIHDALRRPLRSLRISVTDRCNLRCEYCMPEDDYIWTQREQILRFEEIVTLAGIFSELGIERVRLTGGEPLLRHNLSALVRLLAGNPRIRDLSLTTNGLLLADQARALREAGLQRITVSLDTLKPQRFQALARSKLHSAVLEGIAAACEAGFNPIKINSVILRGVNDDELPGLIEFGRRFKAEVRFIEYMDVGGATRWSMEKVVSRQEMLHILGARFGPIRPLIGENASPENGRFRAPAERFALEDGTTFGIIASTTQPFCRSCDRSRLTTDGIWFLCLYGSQGIDLKSLLRNGALRQNILQTIRETWEAREDRGAEERQRLGARGILLPVERLRQDPHQEMHTRGG
jgi:GTP 3',8-cyclase